MRAHLENQDRPLEDVGMQFSEHVARKQNTWTVLILTALLSGVGAAVLNSAFPDWRLVHYPIHAAVESVGAFAAFIVALLILGLRNHGHLGSSYTWVASALIGMGFHARFCLSVKFGLEAFNDAQPVGSLIFGGPIRMLLRMGLPENFHLIHQEIIDIFRDPDILHRS